MCEPDLVGVVGMCRDPSHPCRDACEGDGDGNGAKRGDRHGGRVEFDFGRDGMLRRSLCLKYVHIAASVCYLIGRCFWPVKEMLDAIQQ